MTVLIVNKINYFLALFSDLCNIKLLCFASILFIFHLINQWLGDNYFVYKVRLTNLFKTDSLFRLFRHSLFLASLFLVINHYKYFQLKTHYNNYIFDTGLLNYLNNYLIILLIYILIWSYLTFILFRNRIKKNLSDLYIRKNNLTYFYQYTTFVIISSFTFYLFFILNFMLIRWLDISLINNEIYPFFTSSSHNASTLTYKRGIYISIILSFMVFLLTINTVFKSFRGYTSTIDKFMYLFMLIITTLGIYSGFYCIFNYWQNYILFNAVSNDWINKDKLVGHFSLRITSLLLMWSIVKFCFKTIFNGDLLLPIKYGILLTAKNNRAKLGNVTGYETNYYDIYFFNQIGFYILNVFVAEYIISLSISESNSLITTLFALLPIMVDDYLVVHVYFEKYGDMTHWHKIKINSFNILLILFSTLSLYHEEHFLLLVIYILAASLLLTSHIYNQKRKLRYR